MRTQFHKVPQLARRTRPTIQPQNNGELAKIRLGRTLLPIENKPKCRITLAHIQIPTHNHRSIVVRRTRKIHIIAGGTDGKGVDVRLLEDAVLDIDATLRELGGGIQSR